MFTEHRYRLISAAYIMGFVVLLTNGQSLATSSQKATLTVGTRHVAIVWMFTSAIIFSSFTAAIKASRFGGMEA